MIKRPKRVIIWGYPLHTHTHSYIHLGYYRAFKALGFETYWSDNVHTIGEEFNDSLVITEHFAYHYQNHQLTLFITWETGVTIMRNILRMLED